MHLGSLARIVSGVIALSFLQYNPEHPRQVCENYQRNLTTEIESPISVYYTSGKGEELISCIRNSYMNEHRRISSFLHIRDKRMPNVVYDTLSEGKVGSYDQNKDIITLDTSKAMSVNGRVKCNVISHELVHVFLNRKSQEIGNGVWPSYSPQDRKRFTLEDYSIQFISEGLATYIGNGTRIRKMPANWPRTRDEFYCSDPYILGDYLVTGLLDEFGSSAVAMIIKNPPIDSEILHPKLWQEKIRGLMRRQR